MYRHEDIEQHPKELKFKKPLIDRTLLYTICLLSIMVFPSVILFVLLIIFKAI